MKSYDVCECGAPLRLMERPTPKPVGTEVLLKVVAAGVCHSDLHIWEGHYDLGGGKRLKLSDRGVKLPLTMGHENVGEIVAVGPDAAGVKVGQRMLVHPWLGCGECALCWRGEVMWEGSGEHFDILRGDQCRTIVSDDAGRREDALVYRYAL